MTHMDFDKHINNDVKSQAQYEWIGLCNSKSRKKVLHNAENAYKSYISGKKGRPKFKCKGKDSVKLYFPKDGKSIPLTVERHRVKLPSFGWIQLKEKGYIPSDLVATNAYLSCHAGRYYLSMTFKVEIKANTNPYSDGIGIDLGVKDLATISTNDVFCSINKTRKVHRLEKQLRHQQRHLSRKFEHYKKSLKQWKKDVKVNPDLERPSKQNINKQILKVQRLHKALTDIRLNHINQVIADIIKRNPSFVAIEDLNVKGMMKNKHLSKAIASQELGRFRVNLSNKCAEHRIELRIVDRWFPSSKLCSNCGQKKKDLALKDRVFECEHCKLSIDRDYNASLNLQKATRYKVA